MPLAFLWGDEDYLIDEAVEKIKHDVLGDNISPLNYKRADNPNFADFLELLQTNAMMFGDTVILIKCQKYFLETKGKIKLEDKQTAMLSKAFLNVSDKVHIILVCPTPRNEKKAPDKRKKLYKELIKVAPPQEFQSFKSYEEKKILPYISKMAAKLDLKINQESSLYLIQNVGSSLRELNHQLEKLKLYLYPEHTVTLNALKETVCTNSDIFKLVDFILFKNYSKALNLLSDILQKEASYLPALAFCQTVFSNLVKTKIYSKYMSNRDISYALNQHEFIVGQNIEKLKNINESELIRLKVNLEEMEYQLKSGGIKDPLSAYELAFLGGKS